MRNANKQLKQKTSLSFVLLLFALVTTFALSGCGGGGGGGGANMGSDAAQMPMPGGGQQMPGGGQQMPDGGQQMPDGGSGDTPGEKLSSTFERANAYSWSDSIIYSEGLVIANPIDLGQPEEVSSSRYDTTETPSGTNLTIGRHQERMSNTTYQGYSFENLDFRGIGVWGSHNFQEIYLISGTVVGLGSSNLAQAYSIGYVTGNNPAQGSATWTGIALVFDSNRPRTLGTATAQINVDFTDMTADATFSDFEDRSLSPINYNNMEIVRGHFSYNQNSNRLYGAFYGPNQEEAGGTFSYYPGGLVGGTTQGRALIGGFSTERRQ